VIERDQKHLSRALELAAQARGRTSPNPLVGAVIVKNGRLIGEGFHEQAGLPHAERSALAACEEDPEGATMYVSLEPCAHEGRTPPCTDAILEAKIARVVVASDDPTPKANGRGLGILRDEGVDVEVVNGSLAAEARLLNQPFRKHALTGRPHVVFKVATTLDGKVATAAGDSKWISNEASRARAHRWRAEVDAVAVGIHTATTDDPLLTARVDAVPKQPTRVIFDSEASLPLDSKLVSSLAKAPLIVVCSRAATRTNMQALEAAGVDVIVATGQNEPARLRAALDELGVRDIQSILLEGGPHLAGTFFDIDEIDEMRIFIAPLVAGGGDSLPVLGGEGVESIDNARKPVHMEHEEIDGDLLICARLKDW
jgi:diaminohydroxyphosphoribosylaminopyrimidine deaminase / 5-amino-6-(5-phosphoribosylamino)uracil reductase